MELEDRIRLGQAINLAHDYWLSQKLDFKKEEAKDEFYTTVKQKYYDIAEIQLRFELELATEMEERQAIANEEKMKNEIVDTEEEDIYS